MKLSKICSFSVSAFMTFAVIMIAVVCYMWIYGKHVEYKIVKTKNGLVRGFRDTTMNGKVDYYAFKGIPYAKSPIGELRFKVRIQ